ncbi:MAG: SEC-C domain-containing protein [Deltaproteobacteria bacterium]|nr:SEC-C domain-containing protein [Deltaproteobacteria bacterium]
MGIAALRRKCGREALVCERALARVAGAKGLKVGELPPEARAIKAALAVTLDHGPMLEGVGPELILELIDAAVAFEAAEPWEVFDPDEPLSIRIDAAGRQFEGCVLGTGGEEFGLALYHQAGSIDRVHRFMQEGRPEAARALACTTVLLAHDDSCSVAAVHAMTGVELAPLVFHITGGRPRAAGPDEVAVLVAGLRAVTALAEDRAPRGETRDPAHRVVAHAARVHAATEPRALYTGVGRNEPCPCGSGKKFKRCHDGAVEAAPSPAPSSPRAILHARDERLAADILEHGKRRFGGELLARRLGETLGDRASLGQFVTPWLAYMLPFEGEPLAAHFLRSRGVSVSAEDRRWIERQLATPVGVWEILRVDHGRGVEAVDLLTGARCFVDEVRGSGVLAPRDAILARAVADEVVVFCGVHKQPLDPMSADAVVTRFAASTSQDEAARRLFELWEDQVAEQRRKAATPMKITNTDGHDAATVEDRFALRRGGFEAAFARLAALDGVNVDAHDRSGARFTFTRAGNAKHAHWANTIVGSARLTATRLVVLTNSSERAEALTARLRDALGELATWKKRTREALPEMLGGSTVMIDGQRVTSPAEPTLREACLAWLDQPAPSLGDRTPREAARDAGGRRGVHLLLKQQENHYARKPVDGLDPTLPRRELGLDELGQPLANVELVRALGSGRKLSETVIDFARPMLDAEGVQSDKQMRDVLGFAIAVWNAIVTAAQAGETLDAATLRAGVSADRWLAWVEPLLTRKRERFEGDLRLVGDWHVRSHRDEIDIQMDARVSPTLHAQLEAAGML